MNVRWLDDSNEYFERSRQKVSPKIGEKKSWGESFLELTYKKMGEKKTGGKNYLISRAGGKFFLAERLGLNQ